MILSGMQPEGEGCALTQIRFHSDASAEALDQTLRDGESHSGARRLVIGSGGPAIERLENAGQVLR